MSTFLSDLIRYESEGTLLDFKAVQYEKPQFEALIKDVVALANAHVQGAGRVVCGVKLHTNGDRELIGVPPDDFMDGATYQQLVHENVEPSLEVHWEPVLYDGLTFGVLSVLRGGRPYVLRKNFGRLKKGQMWIRKGTHNTALMREDLERVYQQRRDLETERPSELTVAFPGAERATRWIYERLVPIDLPSDRARRKIKEILKTRKQRRAALGGMDVGDWGIPRLSAAMAMGHPPPYKDRSTETLEANLAVVEKTYAESDYYHLVVDCGMELNPVVWNEGPVYVEDAVAELRIPRLPALLVPERPPRDPDSDFPAVVLHYPSVTVSSTDFVVREDLGDIRHQGQATPLFREPLLLALIPQVETIELPIQVTLFGRNLHQPHETELTIELRGIDHAP